MTYGFLRPKSLERRQDDTDNAICFNINCCRNSKADIARYIHVSLVVECGLSANLAGFLINRTVFEIYRTENLDD